MFKQLEPTKEHARGVQHVLYEHYCRLGIWTPEEVAEFIANPDNPARVERQLASMALPHSNVNEGGNGTPIYGGLFAGGELAGVAKVAAYTPKSFRKRGHGPYLNIQELVVDDRDIYDQAIAECVVFGAHVLQLHPDQPASTEAFHISSETDAYTRNGFEVVSRSCASYSFGSKTVLDVDRLVRPNLRPQ